MSTNDQDQTIRLQEERQTQTRAGLLNIKYIDSRGWASNIQLVSDVLSVQEMYDLRAVPVAVDTGRMTFVITSGTPQQTIKNLRARFADYHVNFGMISESGYKELMLRHNPPQEVHYDDISIQTEGESTTLEQVSRTLESVRSDDILDYLITQAQRLNASDIHLENEKTDVRMRFRVDGTLHEIARLSKDKYRQLSSSIAIKADVSVAAPEPQTGHLSHDLTDQNGVVHSLNMRIETAPTSNGQDAVIRLFSLDRELMKIENLGLSEQYHTELQQIIDHPHGMVLVVGPTGSGKTTTLYSILEQLNNPTRKIITLEDPVEYGFAGVTQIPVKAKSGDESFADKLRAVLRLDPDVIMIGEIRDVDTARTALQAALTGHLVLSTFHAANAATALTRMLDLIGDNPLFTSAVRLVVAQRLLRRLDDTTKQPYQPDEAVRQRLIDVIEQLPDSIQRPAIDQLQLFRPGTSPQQPFGYTGRMMVAELMTLSPEIQYLLQQQKNVSAHDLEHIARKQGMMTLLEDGVMKAVSGQTSIEEVFRVIDA